MYLICMRFAFLTHWSRETRVYIYIGNLTIIGSENGLSSDRRQIIIWTNAGKLLFGPSGIILYLEDDADGEQFRRSYCNDHGTYSNSN